MLNEIDELKNEYSHFGNNSAILFNLVSCNISRGNNAILRANVVEPITIHLQINRINT